MLEPNATIIDIAARLSKPTAYVRGVLENLYACMSEHKLDTLLDRGQHPISNDVQVRIGRMGEGRAPHYRIERGWEVDHFADEAKVYGIFNGSNHKTLMEWDVVRDEHWSTEPIPLEQVRDLLGKLRGITPSTEQ